MAAVADPWLAALTTGTKRECSMAAVAAQSAPAASGRPPPAATAGSGRPRSAAGRLPCLAVAHSESVIRPDVRARAATKARRCPGTARRATWESRADRVWACQERSSATFSAGSRRPLSRETRQAARAIVEQRIAAREARGRYQAAFGEQKRAQVHAAGSLALDLRLQLRQQCLEIGPVAQVSKVIVLL